MIVVPAGSFQMGSPNNEMSRESDEGPVHTVTISKPFAAGVCEVTFDEWNACVKAGGCSSNKNPSDQGWGRGTRPVINVSWNDAKEYVKWLSERTDEEYRLLTESEWEYAARAETTTRYSFGNTISDSQANYSSTQTVTVGSYPPNAFGLHDVHGNVGEWTEDCWHADYDSNNDGDVEDYPEADAPLDGSAWLEAGGGACSQRVLRGGSWFESHGGLRSASRRGSDANNRGRNNFVGFRVAKTL